MVLVAICTAALIIVLSVFNGLTDLIGSLYSSFDPEIKIEAVEGKSFKLTPELLSKIEGTEGVAIVTEVIEDYVYVNYRDASMIVTIKGFSDNFLDQKRIDNAIVSGELKLKEDGVNYAIMGRGVQYALSINPTNDLYPLQMRYIKSIKSGLIDPSRAYNNKNILPGSVFVIEKNYDENYIFVPLSFAQDLLEYGNKRTSLEIKVGDEFDIDNVKKKLEVLLADQFNVRNQYEQHADIYKLFKLEKLFVFIAFSLILAVGSINIFFALSMIAIDKKRDISILYSLGADDRLIKSIFIAEGAIISLGGAIAGLIFGGIICWVQQTFGLVSMGIETSVLDNYPVQMKFSDFLYTSLSLVLITILISYRPAIIATRYRSSQQL